jgi:endoglucanase
VKARAGELLRDLSRLPGVSSDEEAVARYLENGVGLPCTRDRFGNLVFERAAPTTPSLRVLLAAHMDEVGFVVQSITSDGYLRFMAIGGWLPVAVAGLRVLVLARGRDPVPGVVGIVPPHHASATNGTDTVPAIDKLHIDIGAGSADDARRRIGVLEGDLVVPDTEFRAMADPDLLLGKAFDNRAGVALLMQSLEELDGQELDVTLVGAGTVQEEVGVRGATVLAQSCACDLAFVLEGAPADDLPGTGADSVQAALGKGVQIRVLDASTIMSRPLVSYLTNLARELAIPHQVAVRRSGGTDARAIQVHGGGVPVAVIGVPVRYAHTAAGILHLDDYVAALRLVLAAVSRTHEIPW